MTRKQKKYLYDIKISIEAAQAYLQKFSVWQDFSSDMMAIDATERRVGIIGEATHQLRKLEVTLAQADALVNRRNTIIHQYDQVTEEALWRHIKEDLPSVLEEVVHLLNQPDSEE